MQNQKEETVKVMVRVRPINQMEIEKNSKSVIVLNKNEKCVSFDQSLKDVTSKMYVYDNVFDG